MSPVFAAAILPVLVGAALWVPEPNPKAQKLAVERIKRLNGQVEYEKVDFVGRFLGRKRVNFVWLSRTKVTDDDLKVFRDLPRVERVWMVSCPRVTDRGLEHLRGARKLWWLDISDTPITDKGLEHLRGHTGMRLLEMYSTRVTDDGLFT